MSICKSIVSASLFLLLCLPALSYHSPPLPSKSFAPSSTSLYKKKSRAPPKAGGFGSLIRELRQSTFQYTGSITPQPHPSRRPPPEGLADVSLPDYYKSGTPQKAETNLPWVITSRTSSEIERMVISGSIARTVLDHAGSLVRPGVTTQDIDRAVYDKCEELGAYPSPLNYRGFPGSCCTSVNEIVCHGIPDERPLAEGDVINIDITVFKDGVHGDCSEMFVVEGENSGEPDKRGRELIQTTYDCWLLACKSVKPGMLYRDIGTIIEDYVTDNGFTTVRGFCGHGIGPIFHCNPNVLHYTNSQKSGVMEAGHTFTIEPMICEGSATTVTWPDEWTVATKDGGRSAQFEHTLLVTEDGVKPLTGKNQNSRVQWWEMESKVEKGPWKGEGSDVNVF